MSEQLDQFSSRLSSLEVDAMASRGILSDIISRGITGQFARGLDERLRSACAELKDLRRTMNGIGRFAVQSQASRTDRFQRYEELARCRDQFSRLERELSSLSACLWQRNLFGDESNMLFSRSPSFTDSPRLFAAVDGAVACLMGDIFGQQMLSRSNRRGSFWMPVTLLGADYSIVSDIGVAHIPRVDLHRCRMWPLFAHELSHLKFRYLTEPLDIWFVDESISELVNAEILYGKIKPHIDKLILIIDDVLTACLHIFPVHPTHKPVSDKSTIASFAEELICDAVATYICGPSMLLAFGAHSSVALPVSRNATIALLTRHTHPPSIVRMRLMREQLVRRGFGDWLKEQHLDKHFWLQRDATKALPEYYNCILKWMNQIDDITECLDIISRLMVNGRTHPFDMSDMEIARTSFIENDRKAQVSHLLMRTWIKRLDVALATEESLEYESEYQPGHQSVNPVFYAVALAVERRHEWLHAQLQG